MTEPSLRDLVRGATVVLDEAGVLSPEHDARALAAHVLGIDRFEPALAPPVAPAGFRLRFAAAVERRRGREPLQHIVGRAAFRHVELLVEPGVFVPRPETEVVAGVAIDEARRRRAGGGTPTVVELCCGAGGIAVSVAVEVPGVDVVAVDLSAAAVSLTARNAARAGVGVRVLEGDVGDAGLLAELDGTVDVVVANPPYIPPDAEPTEPEVRDHDPALALYGGGTDGLQTPRAVVEAATRLLRPGGLLVMEHAEVQARQARELLTAGQRFVEVRTGPDLTGRDRMVVGRRRDPHQDVKDSRP